MNSYDEDIEWYCDCCGARLDEQSGFTTETGSWKCRECGEWNDVTDDNIIYDDDDDGDDDDEDIPEGCAACGGHYPECRDGCPLFDDD